MLGCGIWCTTWLHLIRYTATTNKVDIQYIINFFVFLYLLEIQFSSLGPIIIKVTRTLHTYSYICIIYSRWVSRLFMVSILLMLSMVSILLVVSRLPMVLIPSDSCTLIEENSHHHHHHHPGEICMEVSLQNKWLYWRWMERQDVISTHVIAI